MILLMNKIYLYEQKDKISQKIIASTFPSHLYPPKKHPTLQPEQQTKHNRSTSPQRKDSIARGQSVGAVVEDQAETQAC